MTNFLPADLTETILNLLQDGVMITGDGLKPSDRSIIYVNKAWEKLTGYSAAQAIGSTSDILYGEKTSTKVLAGITSDLKRTNHAEAELTVYKADGTPLRIILSVFPIADHSGKTHYISILRDLTRQKNKIDRLQCLIKIQHEAAIGSLQIDHLRQQIAEIALEVTGADGAVVEEAEDGDIVYRAVAGAAEGSLNLRLRMDQSLSGLAYGNSSPLICRNVDTDDRVILKKKARQIGFVSGIVVPLKYQEQIFGVLKVYAGEPDRFDTDDLQLLELASGVLAASLSKAVDYTTELEHRAFLLDALPIMISYIDKEKRYQEVNAAYEKIFKRSAETIRGRHVRELLGEEGFERIRPYMEGALRGERINYEDDVTFPNGEVCTLHGEYIPRFASDGTVSGFYAIVRDITDTLNAQTDYLTGLTNRRRFEDEGSRLLALAQRHQEPIALIMADIDHFKTVNDTLGHLAGDEVLKKFAELLLHRGRDSDLPGRWGGEEFVLLLSKTDIHGARELAERLRTAVAGTVFANSVRITVSIGVAAAHPDDSILTLQEKADKALYRAKETGRNNVQIDAD